MNGAMIWGVALIFGIFVGLCVAAAVSPFWGWGAGILAVVVVIRANVK